METGTRHEHGVGARQDMDQAIGFYCQAAALGHPEARYHLGWIYATGRAGKVDQVLAAAWFKAAAESKHARAPSQIKALGAEGITLDQAPVCVLTGAMVARKIPKPAPGTKQAPEQTEQQAVAALGPDVREVGGSDIKALIRRLAPDYNLDPELVLAVVTAESNFNPHARSNKNAQGLMQLIPATAARFGVRDPWDPLDNLRGGMAYLRWLLDHFDGDVELALAGYNAGEGAVQEHGGIPPFAETQGYVRRITQMLSSNQRRTSPLSRPTSQPQPAAKPIETGARPELRSTRTASNPS